MSSAKVLIVDDEKVAQDLIRTILDLDELYTCVASDGKQCIIKVQKENPNLVLLDLKLPDTSGFEVCQNIRRFSQIPIIAVSALNSLEERELFLSQGGDDYITKPFTPEELRFRVWAALRKAANEGAVTQLFWYDDGYLKINLNARQVKVNENEVALTAREFDVLHELVKNTGKCVTYEQLRRTLRAESGKNVLYLHICRLRNMIEPDPSNPGYIITLPHVGYRFCSRAEYGLSLY